jgi:hypothetical protein
MVTSVSLIREALVRQLLQDGGGDVLVVDLRIITTNRDTVDTVGTQIQENEFGSLFDNMDEYDVFLGNSDITNLAMMEAGSSFTTELVFVCSALTDCGGCLSDEATLNGELACGWCAGSNSCIALNGACEDTVQTESCGAGPSPFDLNLVVGSGSAGLAFLLVVGAVVARKYRMCSSDTTDTGVGLDNVVMDLDSLVPIGRPSLTPIGRPPLPLVVAPLEDDPQYLLPPLFSPLETDEIGQFFSDRSIEMSVTSRPVGARVERAPAGALGGASVDSVKMEEGQLHAII